MSINKYFTVLAGVALSGCASPETKVLEPYTLANGQVLQDTVSIGANGKGTAPVVTTINTYDVNKKGKAVLVSSSSGSERSTVGLILGGAVGAVPASVAAASSGASVNTTINNDSSGGGGPTPVSDRRLKRDILRVAELANGLGVYRFRYLWSDEVFVGVMAQEMFDVMPEAVVVGSNGYMAVNYTMLGIEMLSWDQWTERLETGASSSYALRLDYQSQQIAYQ